MPIKVGINGFGRIGRVILRTCIQKSDLVVSAINDPAVDIEYICYLIKFDSTHGKFNGDVTYSNDDVIVNGNKIKIFHEKLPSDTPWHTVGVQYVVEASGMFTNLEKASGHLANISVKRVLVTAPSVDIPMMILGVNEDKIDIGYKVISCASSTLYCLAPIIKILEDNYGISEGFITSIHSMTPSLKPLDGLCLRGKHWRDHRSIHQNIIPAATGACKALSKIIPQVKDKMTGLAFRVPIVNVSVLDITIRLNKGSSMENILSNIEKESVSTMKNIIRISKDDAVSSDFLGDENSCVCDANSSLQLSNKFFKLICWYENEYSYACRVIDTIKFSENQYNIWKESKFVFGNAFLFKRTRISQSVTSEKFKHDYCYDFQAPAVISTSQETGLKTFINRDAELKTSNFRPMVTNQTTISHDNCVKNEVAKIGNDNETIDHIPKQNRDLFSNDIIKLCNASINYKTRTHERLELVKKEFKKMVNMTEDLLRKSNSDKSQISLLNTSVSDVGNGELKINDVVKSGESRYTNIYQDTNTPYELEDKTQSTFYQDTIDDNNVKHKEYVNDNTNGKHCIFNIEVFKSSNPLNQLIEQNHSNLESNIEQTGKFTTLKSETNDKSKSEENYEEKCDQNGDPNKEKCMIEERPKLEEKVLSTKYDEDKSDNSGSNREKNVALVKQETEIISKSEIKEKTSSVKYDGGEHFTESKGYYDFTDGKNEEHIQELKKKDENFSESQKSSSIGLDLTEKVIHTQGTIDTSENIHSHLENRSTGFKKKIINSIIRKMSIETQVIMPGAPLNVSTAITDFSNVLCKRTKSDLYDKLDSVSNTDSDNSFQIDEKRSQVINITDLTNSIEDLDRLDKLCRIIEISDELSDQLFSALDNTELNKKDWSFKELCERIKLDDFCNKIFAKSAS